MDGIWGRSRARGYGITALMAVVVFGASVTVRDALTQLASDQQPAGAIDVAPPEAPVATTSEAPAAPVPQVAQAPVVEAPAPVTPAPTMRAVTTPEPPTPAPPAPVVDPQSI